MKKFIKLIVLLFVLVGLIIGYFVYDSYLKKQEEQPTPTVEEPKTFDVHVLGGESITSIQYVHKERDAQGNVTKEENISLKLMDGKWKLESDLEFPVDPTYVGYMIESLSRITATKVIAENLDNQADYGMNDPLYEIKY